VGRGVVAFANEVERVQNEGPAKRKRLQRAPLSSRRLREFLRGTPGAQSGTPLKLSWGNPSKTHGSQGEERRRRTQGGLRSREHSQVAGCKSRSLGGIFYSLVSPTKDFAHKIG